MKALILAAGEGTRMKPLTDRLPKPLLPVAGKPCIGHTIDVLKKAKVKDMVFVVGFQRKEIQAYLEGIKGIEGTYIEQKKRLGTAHAIGMAQTEFKEPFLCLNGDVVATIETINGMKKAHKDEGRSLMVVSEVEDARGYGIVTVDKSNGLVKNIIEKPKRIVSKLINTGLYLFTPSIFDAIERTPQSSRGEYEITGSILNLKDKAMAYEMKEPYLDISVPWDLLTANEFLMKDLKTNAPKGQLEAHVKVHGNLIIGRGTVVKSGTYIEGNVIIGDEAKIGPNAYLRGSTYIGDNCHIGASVEIKNSVIMEGTNIPHHNYVGDSIIGRRCNLGSGTKVANLRLDNKPITSYVKRKPINSGRRKLGVIMGDDVKIGINAMMNVGSVVGSRTIIGPGAIVNGWIEPGSQVF